MEQEFNWCFGDVIVVKGIEPEFRLMCVSPDGSRWVNQFGSYQPLAPWWEVDLILPAVSRYE